MTRFAVPAFAAVVVASLATLLLSIGARSPYTHANLAMGFDWGYTRTEQALLGPPVPYRAGHGEMALPARLPAEARGKALLVVYGCASCHGLDGQGGTLGPPIVGLDAATVQARTEKGPSGMPSYGPAGLPKEALEAIVAYLTSPAAMASKPDPTARRAAASPTAALAAPITVLPSPTAAVSMAAAPAKPTLPAIPGTPTAPGATASPTVVAAPVSPTTTTPRAAPTATPPLATPPPAAPRPSPAAAPVAASAAGASCAQRPASEVCRLRVEITDNGFNDLPSGFEVEVKQGQPVELTFVFAQKRSRTDSHIILLSGYDLKTEELDARLRQTTLKFVAEKPGCFELKCTNECNIHRKLSEAYLVIR